ncbi:Zn-dependent hydrolase [Lentibacillus kapialis]|uniref:Zn-dependent hydrolase n=1 Tax=Lentibacillus kapialis TaxID=340214 RepID=A0A917Q0Z5_9BACI|nr:MBL fold metallo-hydrolase [Lentibacillus kapialis]GGK04556.1 Zn-dependent hydrolase [Lentibacillus kapialis]
MFFRSFFDDKLAQYSYLIGCQQTGEAIVIDPARDVDAYFEAAKAEGLNVTAAAETHIHADFVSGARELALRHNVKLYLSDEGDTNWKYQYVNEVTYESLKDGDVFSIGNVQFEVMHTPGHTPESLSFILTDKGVGSDVPMGVFTGDFVFVGDVGRPDLLEKAANVAGSTEDGARQMFDALQRFKELPDSLQVWPGHGAGSACGKSLGAVPMSTAGYEKYTNWALLQNDKETFVKELTEEQPEPPKYFAMMKKVNKEGPGLVDHSPIEEITSTQTLEDQIANDHVIVLDTRPDMEFSERHIPGTLNIAFNKSFPNWAGWLLDYDEDIVMIAAPQQVTSIKRALESIGLDRLKGYASTAIINDVSKTESYENMSPEELESKLQAGSVHLVDVRNQSEWDEGHAPDAQHIMLGYLPDRINEIPTDKAIAVNCQSGKRSAIAASLLQKNGIKNVINLQGGFGNWLKKDLPVQK